MAAKFDPQKPYGTITGDHYGRAYDQGGKFFDIAGNEIVVTETMRLQQLAREAEAVADSGDDKDAVIARLTAQLARQAALLDGRDAKGAASAEKDAKIDDLKKQVEANDAKLKTSAVDAQLAKQ